MTPKDVIIAFVAHLAASGKPGLAIDSWPDEVNRTTEDIDAVAGKFAIEHTSVDVVDGMRQRNDWFMKAAGELEAELNPTMQFRLRINFDYEAVDKGQKWDEVKNALRDWIVNQSSSLPNGYGYRIVRAPGVPFDLRVEKVSDEKPLLVFSRSHKPENDTLESSIGPLIMRKARKLVPYTQSGMTGVLLIQSEDLAFMNRVRLVRAIVGAFPNALPEGVDQIWYADATIPNHLEFHDLVALGELIKREKTD